MKDEPNGHKMARRHAVTYDIPMPGHYPCLTLQLNVTRYAADRVGKLVLVVREPSAGVEVHRVSLDVCSWAETEAAVESAVRDALGVLSYMQDGTIAD